MIQWSYEQHKHREIELLQNADALRLSYDGSAPQAVAVSANPIVAWVGHRLIELGERLAHDSNCPDEDIALAS